MLVRTDHEVNQNAHKKNIGIWIVYLYVLLSFIGQPPLMSSKWQSLSLNLLLGISILTIIFFGRLKIIYYHFWYIVLICVSLVSCLYAIDPFVAYQGLYSLLVVFGLTVAISTMIKNEEEIKKIIICFSSSGFILFVVLLVTNQLNVDERLGNSLFGNANIFAGVVMLSLMCSIWLALYSNGVMKYCFIIFAATQVYMLFLSGGRKYILIPALFLYLLFLLKKNDQGKSKIIQYTVLFSVVVGISYWLMFNIPQLYSTVGYRMEGFFELFSKEAENKIHADVVRQSMIQYGIDFFTNRPILGYGIDNYKILFDEAFGRYVYSHNNYIEILVNYGLFGFVVYYSFYLYLIYKLWRDKCRDTKLRDFFLAFMVCLLPLEMGIISYNQYFIQIFISLVSGYLFFSKVKEKKDWSLSSQ